MNLRAHERDGLELRRRGLPEVVLDRFQTELSWLGLVPGVPQATARLLAGRAAGTLLAILPMAEQNAAAEDPATPCLLRLAGALPPIAQLTVCWRLLGSLCSGGDEPPDLAALRLAERLWNFAASAESLLVQGGDDRLTLDPATGLNRYLCSPWPQPDTISFSSCTASSISARGLAAAEQTRRDLLAEAAGAPDDAVLSGGSRRIGGQLLDHFGVGDSADALLAASGTDAVLLLTGLLAAERPRQTITTILMSPTETGSGVPEAAQGRHFAPCTAAGVAVEKGGAVDGFPPGLALASVALRTPDGLPRAADIVAADCETAIEAAGASGHVVLHAIDGSKTGLTAPDILALDLLADRFGNRLDIVIDACQLRVEPETIRLYLDRGWPVLITGSKFFGAPGFCGAILFPRRRLRQIAGAYRLPDGLGAYASLTDGMISRQCPGLLLRWAAALAEMVNFARMSPRAIAAAIDAAGAQARSVMMRQPRLHLIQAPRPVRGAWSDRPSVLTFGLRGQDGLLSAAALRPFYLAMAADEAARLHGAASDEDLAIARQRCLLGQPVQLGGPGIGGLRVAFSAAQIASGQDLRPALATVFSKLDLLLRLGTGRDAPPAT